MNRANPYPFYSSLRFRFGVLFGCLFLLFTLAIVFFLYDNVVSSLRSSFRSRLQLGASVALQKTEINPLVVPLPQKGEYFRLLYNNTRQTDTLYSNLPSSFTFRNNDNWQCITSSRIPETGGAISIVYVLPAGELSHSIHRLQTLLFIYIPLSFLLSLFIGYFLSGFLLQPVSTIISKANDIDLQSEIALLKTPSTKGELYELTIVLNRMLQRISRQATQQTAFFASASHELRTPLSNMLTQLQVLQKQTNNKELQAALDNQVQEVQRLRKIVSDFLLMSQLTAGTLPVHVSNTDVIDACMLCLEKLKTQAGEKGQTFRLTAMPEDADFTVSADTSHLQIIVINLLTNAVKYGKGHSVIDLIVTKEADHISVQISNAISTRAVSVENIATEFARDANQPQEGFGLGLWLSKQLAEKNGGVFSFQSGDFVFTVKLLLKGLG